MIVEDYLESRLELNDEMKDRFRELESVKKEDMFSSDEALQYLRKIKGES